MKLAHFLNTETVIHSFYKEYKSKPWSYIFTYKDVSNSKEHLPITCGDVSPDDAEGGEQALHGPGEDRHVGYDVFLSPQGGGMSDAIQYLNDMDQYYSAKVRPRLVHLCY